MTYVPSPTHTTLIICHSTLAFQHEGLFHLLFSSWKLRPTSPPPSFNGSSRRPKIWQVTTRIPFTRPSPTLPSCHQMLPPRGPPGQLTMRKCHSRSGLCGRVSQAQPCLQLSFLCAAAFETLDAAPAARLQAERTVITEFCCHESRQSEGTRSESSKLSKSNSFNA